MEYTIHIQAADDDGMITMQTWRSTKDDCDYYAAVFGEPLAHTMIPNVHVIRDELADQIFMVPGSEREE